MMSENLFGVWKKRFPILKALRTDFEFSQRIIVATAILFNLGRMEGEEESDDDSDEEEPEDDIEDALIIDEDRGTARFRGQSQRDSLLASMS